MALIRNLPKPIIKMLIGVWRRRWLVAILAWIGALLGWAATTTMPDVYESQAQVYIGAQSALDSTMTEFGNRPNFERQVRIIKAQLLSRENLQKVIAATGLDEGVEGPIELERRIENLATFVQVESDEDQYFVIRYGNVDPVMAQRVVAAVVDLLIEQNLSTAQADVERALADLDRQIVDRAARLDAIDAQIIEFRRQNADDLLGTDRLIRRVAAKEEEFDRIEEQIGMVNLRRQRLLTTLATTPRYTPGSDLDQLKLELASLRTQFNENYPDIVRLKDQIEQLESGSDLLPVNPLYTDTQQNLSVANNELQALRVRRNTVQGEITTLLRDAADTPEAEAQLQKLVDEREQIAEFINDLRDERSQTELTQNFSEGSGGLTFRLFEAPTMALEPSWPPRGLLAVGILILAVGGATMVAVVLTQLDPTYSQASDLDTALGLPVLGSISPVLTSAHVRHVVADRTALICTLGGLVALTLMIYWFVEIRTGDIPAAAAEQIAASQGVLNG